MPTILKVANVFFTQTGNSRIDYAGGVARLTANGFRIPIGTSSERPPNETGVIRFNTSTANYEVANAGVWSELATKEFVGSATVTADQASETKLAAVNSYTRSVGTAGNSYTQTVGTAGNNYTLSIGIDVGAGANVYARTVGTAGNNYAQTVGAGANGWANTVATYANAYARVVGDAANSYTRTVGDASNSYTRTVGTAGNNYTITVGTAGNNYTRAVGLAGNSYADFVASGKLSNGSVTLSGALTTTGLITDSIGAVRAIPINSKTSSYTLIKSDVGKFVSITTGGIQVPAAVFAPGDAISIYNNSGLSQTITQGASATLYLGGTATTGNRTLAQRGIATILCVGTNEFVITGSGLS